MVLPAAEKRVSREEILIENARLSFLCSGGRLNSMACEPYIRLLERGSDILDQSALSHTGRLGLIEVMGHSRRLGARFEECRRCEALLSGL